MALTVALTLAPLAVEAGQVHQFVTTFLERWGAANGAEPGRRAATAVPPSGTHLAAVRVKCRRLALMNGQPDSQLRSLALLLGRKTPRRDFHD